MVLMRPPGTIMSSFRGRIWYRELFLELYLDGYSTHALLISWRGEAFSHDRAGRCATAWLVEGRMKGGVYERRLGGGGEGRRERE